jgi:hypothetical protein
MLAAPLVSVSELRSPTLSGINQHVIYCIAQIKTTFVNDVGNRRTGTGTGFFLRTTRGESVFITNRHNLDPALKLGSGWTLAETSIRLRRLGDQGEPLAETRFYTVDLAGTKLLHAVKADVSIVIAPRFVEPLEDYGNKTLGRAALASDELVQTKAALMDFVSFIGFPGSGSEQWWDQRTNTPIARLGTLASSAETPFTNGSIATDDIGLIAGLSFAGSSGSPLFLHQKGLGPGGDVVTLDYTPACIIGIMSGHWREPSAEPAMFRHSGLSYFTRATSINALLSAIEQ